MPELAIKRPLFRLSANPWQLDGSDAPLLGRSFLFTSEDTVRVLVDVCRDELPECGRYTDSSGGRWKRYELPAFGLYSDSEASFENLNLSLLGSQSGRVPLTAQVADPLPRIRDVPSIETTQDLGLDGQGMPSPDSNLNVSEMAERLIDGHLHFVHELYEQERSPHFCWEGNAQGIAFRSLTSTLEKWRCCEDKREPRMALIVRLAEKLPRLLSDVCRRPRRVLSRVREMHSAGRVQQIDGGCLRWLARQPGRTVGEKAGPKQQVLAVVRREDGDTLENRVVRDLILRAIQACNRYIREHKEVSTHVRVREVMAFRRLLRKLFRESQIGTVRPLVGIAQPNYVLQHDPRYTPLWESYLKLVQQQMLEDNVWRWRHRLWSENCGLALLSALAGMSGPSPGSRSDILLHAEQNAGRFVDPESYIAGWHLSGSAQGEQIELVQQSQFDQHPLITVPLRNLGPDYVLVRRGFSRTIHLAAVFTSLDFSLNQDRTTSQLTSLHKIFPTDTLKETYRAIILVPYSGPPIETSAVTQLAGRVVSVRVPLPLQRQRNGMEEQLKWVLSSN